MITRQFGENLQEGGEHFGATDWGGGGEKFGSIDLGANILGKLVFYPVKSIFNHFDYRKVAGYDPGGR